MIPIVPKVIVAMPPSKIFLFISLKLLKLPSILIKLLLIVELILYFVSIFLIDILVNHVEIVLFCLGKHLLQFVVAAIRGQVVALRRWRIVVPEGSAALIGYFTEVARVLKIEGLIFASRFL